MTIAQIISDQIAHSKYRNRKVRLDGHVFASQKEAARYGELRLLEKARHIRDLSLQPRFPLVVNGIKIADYIGDFQYMEADSVECIVEDVKSKPTMTPVYRLKKKLMKALYGIDIREV